MIEMIDGVTFLVRDLDLNKMFQWFTNFLTAGQSSTPNSQLFLWSVLFFLGFFGLLLAVFHMQALGLFQDAQGNVTRQGRVVAGILAAIFVFAIFRVADPTTYLGELIGSLQIAVAMVFAVAALIISTAVGRHLGNTGTLPGGIWMGFLFGWTLILIFSENLITLDQTKEWVWGAFFATLIIFGITRLIGWWGGTSGGTGGRTAQQIAHEFDTKVQSAANTLNQKINHYEQTATAANTQVDKKVAAAARSRYDHEVAPGIAAFDAERYGRNRPQELQQILDDLQQAITDINNI